MGDHKTKTISNQKTKIIGTETNRSSKWMGPTLNGWVRHFAGAWGGAVPSTKMIDRGKHLFPHTWPEFSWHLLMSRKHLESISREFLNLMTNSVRFSCWSWEDTTIFQEVQYAWSLWRFASSIEVSFIMRYCFGKWMQMILLSYKIEM